MYTLALGAAKAASDSSPLWPFWGSIIVALIGFAGIAYSVISQRKTSSQQAERDKQANLVKREEDTLRANVTAQVDLTKDVLDNWKDIVDNLGKQVGDLHGQVERLEDRERKCQLELMSLKNKLLELEGKINSRRGEG